MRCASHRWITSSSAVRRMSQCCWGGIELPMRGTLLADAGHDVRLKRQIASWPPESDFRSEDCHETSRYCSISPSVVTVSIVRPIVPFSVFRMASREKAVLGHKQTMKQQE